MFLGECYWRDAVALTWKLQTLSGAKDIAAALESASKIAEPSNFKVDLENVPPQQVTRAGTQTIEAFFTFETKTGRNQGIVRLCADGEDGVTYKAWTLFTSLNELKGHEEKNGPNRPVGQSHSRDFSGPNWLDNRLAAQEFTDNDPDVVVVGGGQAGLAIAARLSQLGIDTLIVDKNARIGDNWRNRYHALTLHNQVQVNHLPYMPFPPTWPTYIPKDMLANWFEAYVEALELNYWTSSEVTSGRYNEDTQRWTVAVKKADGTQRILQPRHIVMATGVSGIPNIPDIPTLDAFAGPVLHSSQFEGGTNWQGKKAIVIGTGNSGHDIAQDLYSNGAEVTMVQRSPTLVVSIEPSAQLPYGLYSEGLSLEECDFITSATPIPIAKHAHKEFTRQSRELDKSLLAGLDKVGFKQDFGEDNTGWQFKYLTRGGGYYFNVGCSDLLVEGKVKLLQYKEISEFTSKGVQLSNGETADADTIILATGYAPQEKLVANLLGEETADKVGPIWGFGDGYELRNMYCATGQPGLWFIAGSLAQCRINSKYLALQIKAKEKGLN